MPSIWSSAVSLVQCLDHRKESDSRTQQVGIVGSTDQINMAGACYRHRTQGVNGQSGNQRGASLILVSTLFFWSGFDHASAAMSGMYSFPGGNATQKADLRTVRQVPEENCKINYMNFSPFVKRTYTYCNISACLTETFSKDSNMGYFVQSQSA